MMKTVVNKSFIKIMLVSESVWSGPEELKTTKMPIIPKMTEEMINTRVAIFCISLS